MQFVESPSDMGKTGGQRHTIIGAGAFGEPLASGEDRGWIARRRSSRLTVSDVELAPIPGQELI